MGKSKILFICITATLVVVFFAGCSLFSANKEKNSSGVSKDLSSAVSVQSSKTKNAEAPPENSSAHALSQPPESEPGQVLSIKTDSEKFDAKFKKNPIDKKYITDSNNAISTIDMVNVSDKYSKIWQKEITHAYSELEKYMKTDSSKNPETLRAEEKKWQQDKSAALKKINNEILAEGGSMAQVNGASKVMDFYRSRAAQIYRELYDYNKDYTYKLS